MFFSRLFKPSPAKIAAVAQARTPAFYTALRVPDTREGRFELYTLHVVLLVERLKGQGGETSQALFDAYLRGLDDAFRELGVGDVAVPRRMKKLGEAFYGRLRGYEQAPDSAALEALIGRTLPEADSGALAVYVGRARDHLAGQSLEELMAGQVTWPAPQ
jgi:cytochrome b pre-mRNA-processing protein 3